MGSAQLLTDGQFAALMTVVTAGFSAVVGIVKWSVTRLTKSLDDNTQAHLESVRTMTQMSTKLDFVYNATRRVEDFVHEEASGSHEVATKEDPPTGYRHVMPRKPAPSR